MKKMFLQRIARVGLLLGLLLNPHLSAPSIASPDRSIASSGIDATYAVKNLLSSIMETFPELTVQEALSRSALLGIISETDVQLHMYGTFKTVPNPDNPARTIKKFDTDTTHSTTTLNKIARSMLDVLDGKLRPTALASNPFVGLDGKTVAKMMLIINKDGVQGLIDALEKPTPPKKKIRGKKEEEAPTEPEERSLLDAWWESYRSSGVKRVFTQKSKFVAKILSDPKKNDSPEEIPFVDLLKQYAAESVTTTEANGPRQADKQKEELSKIFMTFLTVKDQKQKATGESHAIVEYYSALLGIEFKPEYYTTEELEQIGKALLGQDSTHTIGKDAKGVEDTTAFLAHFVAGNVAFLQTPFDRFTSFSYCTEATIRSLMNSILYNPETEKLAITMLPLEIQKTMGQKFKDFIEKYPAPTATNYYGNSLKEWLDLVSGLDEVIYKNKTGKDAYEISAGAGPKNIVTALNHIFGTKADSFETFATAVEVKDDNDAVIRKISFTPNESGFDSEVTDHGKVIIEAKVGSKTDVSHATFTIKGNAIIDLLNNDTFRTKISKLSDYAKQDLYGTLFKPSTLNVVGDTEDTVISLIFAIRKREISLIKSMLTFGANPNFQDTYFQTPLEVAAYSKDASIAYELLKNGAHITEKALLNSCAVGNLELVKTFIPLLKNNGISPNYLDMLLKASGSHSFPLVDFLLSKGADINGKKYSSSPLLRAIEGNEPIKMVQFLIDKGALVTEKALMKACDMGNFELVKILMPLTEQSTTTAINYTDFLEAADSKSFPLVEFLLEKGANFNDGYDHLGKTLLLKAIKDNEPVKMVQLLIDKGAPVTEEMLEIACDLGNLEVIKTLMPPLEQAYAEPSFDLNLTVQE